MTHVWIFFVVVLNIPKSTEHPKCFTLYLDSMVFSNKVNAQCNCYSVLFSPILLWRWTLVVLFLHTVVLCRWAKVTAGYFLSCLPLQSSHSFEPLHIFSSRACHWTGPGPAAVPSVSVAHSPAEHVLRVMSARLLPGLDRRRGRGGGGDLKSKKAPWILMNRDWCGLMSYHGTVHLAVHAAYPICSTCLTNLEVNEWDITELFARPPCL